MTAATTTASAGTDEREQIERLLQAERRSLELIAGGARLGDILPDLCNAIDAQDPDNAGGRLIRRAPPGR